jgi:RimJ/RimL family protein N-acetyltransferase
LRLRALADAPDAFVATVERDAARPARHWADLAAGGAVFVAEHEGEWAGLAGVRSAGEDAADVWGMWVAPEHRGAGVGRALIDAVAAWARPRGLGRLQLGVSEAAPAAEAMYAAAGFVRTGASRPLRDRVQHDMVLALEPWAPRIETERLLLRRFVPDDLPALHDMRSRAEVVRYLYEEPSTLEDDRARLQRRMRHTRFAITGDALGFAVVQDGTLVGDVSLFLHSAEHRQGEIGFVVHPDHQGRGYATEAARAVLELAFGTYDLHRVTGTLEARNAASARVLEHLGMRCEAHLVENEWVKGEWQSERVYALLQREWLRASRGGGSRPPSRPAGRP